MSSKIYGEAMGQASLDQQYMQRYMLTQNWQIKCKWCSCFGALRLDSSQKKFNAGILAAE
jgi:hypothetical protein